jgi:hypothetical protein
MGITHWEHTAAGLFTSFLQSLSCGMNKSWQRVSERIRTQTNCQFFFSLPLLGSSGMAQRSCATNPIHKVFELEEIWGFKFDPDWGSQSGPDHWRQFEGHMAGPRCFSSTGWLWTEVRVWSGPWTPSTVAYGIDRERSWPWIVLHPNQWRGESGRVQRGSRGVIWNQTRYRPGIRTMFSPKC